MVTASLWFLFFGIAFWPFWAPFSLWMFEIHPARKRTIGFFVVVSLGWGIFLFYPMANDPGHYLTIEVMHHSIHYEYSSLPVFDYVPLGVQKIIYLATVAPPLLICSGKKNLYFGVLVATLALISQFLFEHAFVSVWCFFASFLALCLCRVFRDLRPMSAIQ